MKRLAESLELSKYSFSLIASFPQLCCLLSVGPDTPPEEIEAHENRRQLMELDVLHALRVLKAFQRTRQHLLDRMCVKALGQFEAFDEQTLLKLSDNEIQYLREACAAEHSRRDEGNARNVEDRNGKPSAVGPPGLFRLVKAKGGK